MSRPITDIMRDIARGHFVEQATTELQKIVLAVLEEGKAGTLTIKIKMRCGPACTAHPWPTKQSEPIQKGRSGLLQAVLRLPLI